MYTCVLHIKPKNSPKIDHFNAVNGKRIRDSIPWPPCTFAFSTNEILDRLLKAGRKNNARNEM